MRQENAGSLPAPGIARRSWRCENLNEAWKIHR
jgi:hypothetical protein